MKKLARIACLCTMIYCSSMLLLTSESLGSLGSSWVWGDWEQLVDTSYGWGIRDYSYDYSFSGNLFEASAFARMMVTV
jgi:hypothetical protein